MLHNWRGSEGWFYKWDYFLLDPRKIRIGCLFLSPGMRFERRFSRFNTHSRFCLWTPTYIPSTLPCPLSTVDFLLCVSLEERYTAHLQPCGNFSHKIVSVARPRRVLPETTGSRSSVAPVILSVVLVDCLVGKVAVYLCGRYSGCG